MRNTKARAPQDAGFTLIEALVAMAVLALGAVSLLSATEGYTARISDVSERVAGRWVAEDTLVRRRLGLPPEPQQEMMGQVFDVDIEVTPTDDPALNRLRVDVATAAGQRRVHVLDGYLLSEGGI